MGKEKSYPKGAEAQSLFMEKYGAVIESLKHMPRNTEEEKDARYSFFRQHQTDEMILLLFQAVKPWAAERLLVDRSESEDSKDDKGSSDLLSSDFNKIHKLFLFFMDALREQTRVYKGVTSSGKEYTFFQALGQAIEHIKFMQSDDRKSIKERTGLSLEGQARVMKCAKLLKNAYMTSELDMELDAYMVRAQKLNDACFNGRMTEKECLFAVDFALNRGCFAEHLSLEASYGEDEDGEESLGNYIADPKADKTEEVEAAEMQSVQIRNQEKFFGILIDQDKYQFLLDAKKELFTGAKRSDWEWIVWFTQVNILIALKLKKSYTSKIGEHGISQQRESFSRQKGDPYYYYRYTIEPAGDEAVYHLMEPVGELLHDSVLDGRYLERAFSAERCPEDFYDVYSNLLEDDFNFSNKVQAECLDKSESLVSKKLTRYRNVLMPQLEKWFEITREK